jgi:hypothetical protein
VIGVAEVPVVVALLMVSVIGCSSHPHCSPGSATPGLTSVGAAIVMLVPPLPPGDGLSGSVADEQAAVSRQKHASTDMKDAVLISDSWPRDNVGRAGLSAHPRTSCFSTVDATFLRQDWGEPNRVEEG